MAKIKKRKLRWTASDSPQVVGYKLYWAEGGEKVSYESSSARLGNVTEVVLPDEVEAFSPEDGPVEFGITAMDELGNESDLMTISAPYQFNAPKAPVEFWIEGAEESTAPAEDQTSNSVSPPISLSHHSVDEDQAAESEEDSKYGVGTGHSLNRQNGAVAMRKADN